MAGLSTMLRLARQRLADLPDIPDPWDLTVFTERVAETRGRPIELIPRMMSQYASVATGLWISRADRDQIVYDNSGTELHQDHIVLHELGHMLCGHQGISIDASGSGPRMSGRGLGDLEPDDPELADQLVTAALAAHTGCGSRDAADASVRVLHRGAYESTDELEAETQAYAIWQAAGLRMVPGAGPLDRLTSAFEHQG